MGYPARRYKWADATPGNTLALKHGVFVADRAERVAEEVAQIAERTALQYSWTRPYEAERMAYARALVDEESVRAYLDSVGMLDENHEERRAVRTLHRFSATAARHRRELGITPQAHARLLLLVSEVMRLHPGRSAGLTDDALDALVAQGRALLDSGPERPEVGEGEGT